MNITRKIYYHHTDAGKVVYYARYLDFLEEGRTEYLLSRGVDVTEYAKLGLKFAVVHIEADYKAPARYGDTIDICVRIEKIGNASMHFFHEIKKGGQTLVASKAVLACIGSDFKVKPIPKEMKKALAG